LGLHGISGRAGDAFAKLKLILRKAGERTAAGLWSAIEPIIGIVPPAERTNHCAPAEHDPD
jgi:hypothetical protein